MFPPYAVLNATMKLEVSSGESWKSQFVKGRKCKNPGRQREILAKGYKLCVLGLKSQTAPLSCVHLQPLVQLFIGIILMLMWCESLPEIQPRFQFLDLFAGCAQASTTWTLGSQVV